MWFTLAIFCESLLKLLETVKVVSHQMNYFIGCTHTDLNAFVPSAQRLVQPLCPEFRNVQLALRAECVADHITDITGCPISSHRPHESSERCVFTLDFLKPKWFNSKWPGLKKHVLFIYFFLNEVNK